MPLVAFAPRADDEQVMQPSIRDNQSRTISLENMDAPTPAPTHPPGFGLKFMFLAELLLLLLVVAETSLIDNRYKASTLGRAQTAMVNTGAEAAIDAAFADTAAKTQAAWAQTGAKSDFDTLFADGAEKARSAWSGTDIEPAAVETLFNEAATKVKTAAAGTGVTAAVIDGVAKDGAEKTKAVWIDTVFKDEFKSAQARATSVKEVWHYMVIVLAVALFLWNLLWQLGSVKAGAPSAQAWLRGVLPVAFALLAGTFNGYELSPVTLRLMIYGLLVGIVLVEMVGNGFRVRGQEDEAVAPAGGAKITGRAVVVGLLLGILAAGVGIVNDFKLGLSPLNVGHLPVMLVGVIIVAMLLINPQLSLLERVFGGRVRLRIVAFEWAVILAISCVAVPMMQQIGFTLPSMANVPKHFSTDAGWKADKILVDEHDNLTYLRPNVVFNKGKNDDTVSTFLNGRQSGTKVDATYMSKAWAAWRPVMFTWGPIMVLFFVGLMALTLVVHRQWAVREHIRFPIADFISTVIHGRSQSTLETAVARRQARPLFRTPAFWIFFGAIFGIHLLNGFGTMYPSANLPQVPKSLEMFSAIYQTFPSINGGGLGWVAFRGLLYPSIIAFSFFLAREVSLGLGLAPMVHEIYAGIMVTMFAIQVSEPSEVCWGKGFFNMGAILAIFLSILWLGRSYYLPLIAQSLGAPGKGGGRRLEGVWAMRVFLVGMAATIILLTVRVGVDWPYAIMFVAVLVIIQIVVARINTETGLFIFGLTFFGNEAVIAVFGFEAMGPRLAMLSALFMILIVTSWGSQPLAPIAINSLEVCRRQKINVGRVGLLAGAMIVLALGVSTYVMMNQVYKAPAGVSEFKSNQAGNAQWPLIYGGKAMDKAKTSGSVDNVLNKSTLQRLWPKPVRGLGPWFLAGLTATLLLTFLRLRFTWWPIHPVVMAVWGSWAMAGFGFSFLIGWALRSAITSLFGEAAVEKAKPIMVGVIAGELVAAVFWLGAGWINAIGDAAKTPYVVFPFG